MTPLIRSHLTAAEDDAKGQIRQVNEARILAAVQVCAALGHPELNAADQQQATENVAALLLRGCGLG